MDKSSAASHAASQMHALTLDRPWPDLILHAPEPIAKRVENRRWAPPRAMLGALIALHAGKKYDADAARWIEDRTEGWKLPSLDMAKVGAVVGVARITGWLDRSVTYSMDRSMARSGRLLALTYDRWWIGPVGWLLEDVRALAEPIACRGFQKLWKLPAEVERGVRAQTGDGT